MNTLSSPMCDSLLLQYMDDITIICAEPSPDAAADLINQQLTSIHDWLVQHRVSLNTQKSRVLWFYIAKRRKKHQRYYFYQWCYFISYKNIWVLFLIADCHG